MKLSLPWLAPIMAILFFTLVASYGWLWVSLNFLNFGFLDLRSAILVAFGVLGNLWAGAAIEKSIGREPPPRSALVGLILLAIGCWLFATIAVLWVGSDIDPRRFLIATVYGLSATWIAIPAFLRLAKNHQKQWGIALLFGIAGWLVAGQSIRVRGLDGRGRPMVGWTWEAPRSTSIFPTATSADIRPNSPSPSGSKSELSLASPWHEFMGPDRQGKAHPLPIEPEQFHEQRLRLLWEVAIGASWSSCVTDGKRIWTQEVKGSDELVVALDWSDGSRIWESSIGRAYQSDIGGDGSRATPTIHGDRVLAQSANGTLACLDSSTGKPRWSRSIIDDSKAELLVHGVCGSPLVVADRVYVMAGGSDGWALIGYDLETGEVEVHGGAQKAGYSSLTAITVHQQTILLALGREELVAYDLELKHVLFRYAFSNSDGTICSQPIIVDSAEGTLLLSAGYGSGSRCLRIAPASEKNLPWIVEELWTSRALQTKFSSSVVHQDRIYGLDNGILQAVDAKTGKVHWKKGRYGFGQILLCPPYVLVQCEDGSIAWVDGSTKEYREVLKSKQLNGKTWNHPVWCPPYLLLRNDRFLRCLKLDLH